VAEATLDYPERFLIARNNEVSFGATRIVQRIIIINVEFAEKSAK
jgi:hypothetical protein